MRQRARASMAWGCGADAGRDLPPTACRTPTKVWRSAAEFDARIATPITWMVAIARGRALDLVRSQGTIEEPTGVPDAAADESGPADRQITEQLRRLLACLGELEPAH